MAAAEPWELRPFEAIGPLRFGMSRGEVISAIGPPAMVVEKDPVLVEAHDGTNVQATYDPAGRLIAVEAEPGRVFSYLGIALSGRAVAEVRRDLESRQVANQWDENNSSLVVPALGLSLYAPRESHQPGYVQGVMATTTDYDDVMDQAFG